jgi:hypothetical protein
MRWILCVAIWGVVAPAMLAGQNSAKSEAKTPVADSQANTPSDQELNIRAYVAFLRSDLRNGKTQIMGDVMALDANQAAAFWPIYKDFESDYTKIGDEIVALVKSYVENYDHLTNELADQLATKLLDVEQNRNELKKVYYSKFKSALGPITAARFLQVENQLEKLTDLVIASQLPVAGEK